MKQEQRKVITTTIKTTFHEDEIVEILRKHIGASPASSYSVEMKEFGPVVFIEETITDETN